MIDDRHYALGWKTISLFIYWCKSLSIRHLINPVVNCKSWPSWWGVMANLTRQARAISWDSFILFFLLRAGLSPDRAVMSPIRPIRAQYFSTWSLCLQSEASPAFGSSVQFGRKRVLGGLWTCSRLGLAAVFCCVLAKSGATLGCIQEYFIKLFSWYLSLELVTTSSDRVKKFLNVNRIYWKGL